MNDKRGAAFSMRVLITVILVLLVLGVSILFVSGALGEIFDAIGVYVRGAAGGVGK